MSDIEEVPECLHLRKCPTSGPALRMHMVNAHMNGPRKKCGVCPHNTAGNMGAVGGRRNIQSSDSRTKAFEDATEFPIINPYGELLEVEMLAEIRKDPVEQQQKFIAVIAEDKLPNTQHNFQTNDRECNNENRMKSRAKTSFRKLGIHFSTY